MKTDDSNKNSITQAEIILTNEDVDWLVEGSDIFYPQNALHISFNEEETPTRFLVDLISYADKNTDLSDCCWRFNISGEKESDFDATFIMDDYGFEFSKEIPYNGHTYLLTFKNDTELTEPAWNSKDLTIKQEIRKYEFPPVEDLNN